MRSKSKISLFKLKIAFIMTFILTAFAGINVMAAEKKIAETSCDTGIEYDTSDWYSCATYNKVRLSYWGEDEGESGQPYVSASIEYSDNTAATVLSSTGVGSIRSTSPASYTYNLKKTSGSFRIKLTSDGNSGSDHYETAYIAAYVETHTHSYTITNIKTSNIVEIFKAFRSAYI